MRRMLAVVLLGTGLVIATAGGTARATGVRERVLPGPMFFPESVTAAPDGALFVSSIVTGEIARFAPGSSWPKTFVAEDVNVGTAGVMADPERNVLWACAVDLSFQTRIGVARVRPADRGAAGELSDARRRSVRRHRARPWRRVRDRHRRRADRPRHWDRSRARRGRNASRCGRPIPSSPAGRR